MTTTELSHRRRLLILGICCSSLFLVSLDVTVLNVALPSLQRSFDSSISDSQWTIDSYILVVGSFLMLGGSTADRFGRRRVFQIGLAGFTIGSALCSLAPSLNWLIAFRTLQGIGASMLNPVALSIITVTFTSPMERARALGIWSGVAGVSLSTGPILGGTLIDTVGWRAVFWINIPIGRRGLVLAQLFVPESKTDRPRRFDPGGQLLVIGSLAFLIYGLIEGPSNGWDSPLILGCFIASGVCIASLIAVERARREPLIDLRFFRNAPFSGAAVIAICSFTALGGFLFLNSFYLQEVRGLSAVDTGLHMLPMALGLFFMGPISGRIVGSHGPRIPLIAGAIAIASAGISFTTVFGPPSDLRLSAGYALFGAGFGLVNAPMNNIALSGMPRSQAGVAAAIVSTARQIGIALGVAVIGTVIAEHVARIGRSTEFTVAAHISWWIVTGLGLAVLATTLITTGRWGRATTERTAALIEPQMTPEPKPA